MRQYRLEDGRLVEFDSDFICQCLFALTEQSGRPDAFLARELTDGLTYLLSTETGDEIPGAAEFAEMVEKYLRELGQPVLAKRLSERLVARPAEFAAEVDRPTDTGRFRDLQPLPGPDAMRELFRDEELEEFSLTHIYPRDVMSMHRDGLLYLFGLSRPFELAGSLLNPGDNIAEQIQAARFHSSQFLAIDGADFSLASASGALEELAGQFVQSVRSAAGHGGLAICLNLNQPPPSGRPSGSLFSGIQAEPDASRVEQSAGVLARAFACENSEPNANVEIFWHLCGRDFQPENAARWPSIIELAQSRQNLTFVFDRPRYGGSLGLGLTRENPAALMIVGVQLRRLAQQIPEGALEPFLKKLGSLARLARSAGHAKFDFLRKHSRPEARGGFRLERARLVVIPFGLEAAVRQLSGCPISDDGQGLETAKSIVQRLRQALDQEPPRNIQACVDSFISAHDLAAFPVSGGEPPAAGLTPWDIESLPRLQVRAAGSLHSLGGAGTGWIRISLENAISAEELLGLLRLAWHQTEVHRLKLEFDRKK